MLRLQYLTIVLLAGGLLFGSLATKTAAQQPSDTPEMLYVANQGEASVSIIDMESFEVVETVDLQALGFSENARPHHAIAEPDGSAWYVSLIGENVVLKFDAENELAGQAQLEVPGLMALSPSGEELYVARSMSAVNPPSSVGIIERSSMEVIDEVDVFFSRPHAVATTADGPFFYAASLATNQLMGVDTESLRGEITTLPGETQVLIQLVASADGRQLVGTGQLTGQLLFFEADEEGGLAVTDTVEVGHQPWHPSYDRERELIYVPNKESNTISVVDAAAREVVATIEDEALAEPHGSALSADGRYLFVSNNHQRAMMEQMAQDMATGAEAPPSSESEHGTQPGTSHDGDEEGHDESHGEEERNGTVAIIDTETHEVVHVIEVGRYPTGIGTRAR